MPFPFPFLFPACVSVNATGTRGFQPLRLFVSVFVFVIVSSIRISRHDRFSSPRRVVAPKQGEEAITTWRDIAEPGHKSGRVKDEIAGGGSRGGGGDSKGGGVCGRVLEAPPRHVGQGPSPLSEGQGAASQVGDN